MSGTKITAAELISLLEEARRRAFNDGVKSGRDGAHDAIARAQEESFAARKELADLKAVPFSGQEMECGLCKAVFGPRGGVWKFKAPAEYRCTACTIKVME